MSLSVVPVVERDSLMELKDGGGEEVPGETCCVSLLHHLLIITTGRTLSSGEVPHQVTITVSSP